MKIYFPDDPIKQEMLEALVEVYKDLRAEAGCLTTSHDYLDAVIEKATNKKIEEVLG